MKQVKEQTPERRTIHPDRWLGWKRWEAMEPWFLSTFKTHARDFVDTWMWQIGGMWVLDVVKFDNYLHKKFHYAEEEHGGMRDFIAKEFGEEAANRIAELLTIPKE